MIPTALAAFIGCFSVFLVMAEIVATNKVIRYLAAFIVGIVVTVVLSWLLGWVIGVFHHIG